ncbi:MAG: signal peptide peptidase SppA [Pseudoflavonifractor sp.]|nr:signal peptide peptidase SppA [Alloprevotella sp.]MCM1116770.1 signal peptide peptidase SppA [Pseudoflavonifractor sp.]
MKQFLISFAGSLVALWVTLIVAFLFGIAFIAMAIAGASSSSEGVVVKDRSVLVLDLNAQVTDREAPVDIMAELTGGVAISALPLNQIVASIEKAAEDKNIRGLLIKAGGPSVGLAQAQAIIDAISNFKTSGKWVMAYGDSYTQGDYFISSVADSLMVNPIGMIDLHGLESTTIYFKDFLEKVGVDVQVVKVGTYKSAVEPFLLSDISEANRIQQEAYLGAIWKSMRETIAVGRKLASDTVVNAWANSFAMTKPAEWYLQEGMVDGLRYRHEIDESLRRLSGLDSDDDLREISVTDYYTARKLDQPKKGKGKKMIAVLYATGDITENGQGGIASERIVPQIFDLIDNDKVEGLVLRVNSGGGSAYASEQIWEALEQFKARTGKPFFVSMGDMAASGGYYISCGADRIFAEPVTLTGSIGIFGMIPTAQKLLNDKLGINTASVATNQPSISLFKPMTEAQKGAMQGYVERGYDLFTSRCAQGRHMSQDSIKAIAEGRVWAGSTAMELGLVDRMGSLQDCISAMAEHIDASDNYYVREFPKVKFTLLEEIMSQAGNIRAAAVDAELGEAAPYYRALSAFRDMDPLQARADHIILK